MKHKVVCAYLSGGMEYAKNEGIDWRSDMEYWIRKNLNQKIFNPNSESEKYLRKALPKEISEHLSQLISMPSSGS